MPARDYSPVKRRTSEHVRADLSFNYVERLVLQRGFALDGVASDYGIDAILYTFDSDGGVEPNTVLFQLKAPEDLSQALVAEGKAISVAVDARDINYWREQTYPVIFIVYDHRSDSESAYWLYIQAYLAEHGPEGPVLRQRTVNVRIPIEQRLTVDSIGAFRDYRNDVASQIGGLRRDT